MPSHSQLFGPPSHQRGFGGEGGTRPAAPRHRRPRCSPLLSSSTSGSSAPADRDLLLAGARKASMAATVVATCLGWGRPPGLQLPAIATLVARLCRAAARSAPRLPSVATSSSPVPERPPWPQPLPPPAGGGAPGLELLAIAALVAYLCRAAARSAPRLPLATATSSPTPGRLPWPQPPPPPTPLPPPPALAVLLPHAAPLARSLLLRADQAPGWSDPATRAPDPPPLAATVTLTAELLRTVPAQYWHTQPKRGRWGPRGFPAAPPVVAGEGRRGRGSEGGGRGVAVIFVMLITTSLMAIVMDVIWRVNAVWIATFAVAFISIEGVYGSALMNKFREGGWVPFAIAALLLVPTLSWTYGRKLKAGYEARHALDAAELGALATRARARRAPGACVFLTDLVNGFPPIVRRYAEHTACLRELTLFVTVRELPVRSVLPEERFLVAKELGPAGVYRCVVRYGYMDKYDLVGDGFVASAVAALKGAAESAEEAEAMDSALGDGYVVVFGRTILHMGGEHNCFKRFVINHLYRFLQKNFRSSVSMLKIDHAKTLQIGMLYEI